MFKGKIPEPLLLRNLPVNRRCLELMEYLKQESIQGMPYYREAPYYLGENSDSRGKKLREWQINNTMINQRHG
jgi:hypothetical protein